MPLPYLNRRLFYRYLSCLSMSIISFIFNLFPPLSMSGFYFIVCVYLCLSVANKYAPFPSAFICGYVLLLLSDLCVLSGEIIRSIKILKVLSVTLVESFFLSTLILLLSVLCVLSGEIFISTNTLRGLGFLSVGIVLSLSTLPGAIILPLEKAFHHPDILLGFQQSGRLCAAFDQVQPCSRIQCKHRIP